MRIRFPRAWRFYRTGQVIDAPDGFANELVRRSIAVPIYGPDETAALSPASETAALKGGAATATLKPVVETRGGKKKGK